MPKTSAGIILYRRCAGGVEVLLVHPGGPFWAKRDEGAWSIPKGEAGPGESLPDVARRETLEELGVDVGLPTVALGEARQRSGKVVHAFAVEGDFDPRDLRSNMFEMEWPPRSGRRQTFPEVDRAGWFDLKEARSRINSGQAPFLDRLAAILGNVV